jgi:hypothetical protein
LPGQICMALDVQIVDATQKIVKIAILLKHVQIVHGRNVVARHDIADPFTYQYIKYQIFLSH